MCFFYLKSKSIISHNMFIITMVLFPNIFSFLIGILSVFVT